MPRAAPLLLPWAPPALIGSWAGELGRPELCRPLASAAALFEAKAGREHASGAAPEEAHFFGLKLNG